VGLCGLCPQERARLLTEAFKRLDSGPQTGRIGRASLITWLSGQPSPDTYQDKLRLDQAMAWLFAQCDRQPDRCIPLHTFLKGLGNVKVGDDSSSSSSTAAAAAQASAGGAQPGSARFGRRSQIG
jgi:hypothetical protein